MRIGTATHTRERSEERDRSVRSKFIVTLILTAIEGCQAFPLRYFACLRWRGQVGPRSCPLCAFASVRKILSHRAHE
jgi:hypothetical protein